MKSAVVKVMLDLSPESIDERIDKHGVSFGQLRTPLTAYRIHGGIPYALDNERMHQNHETVRRWAAKHGLHPGQSVATPPVIPDPPKYLPPEPDIWALWMEAMFTVWKRQAKP